MKNKNILIVYATREGQTQKIAEQISRVLIELGINVEIHNAKESFDFHIESFDLVLFGASIHSGKVEKELLEFIQEHRNEIRQKQNAFFLVQLASATSDPKLRNEKMAKARRQLDEQLYFSFDRIELISGALKYSKYSFFIKWIMKHISKQAGGDSDTSKDYEYTDWKQVEDFARELGNM